MQKSKIKILILLSTFYPLFSASVSAATLYLEPPQGQYQQWDTFIVDARIDTEGKCVNAVEANIKFPQDILEAVDFSQGGSILTLWLEKPEISQDKGEVSFIGGIPGGFCGVLPGDPGKSNLLGRIAFRAKISGERASLNFSENSKALLNDGYGTEAELSAKGANFVILSDNK